MVLESVAAMSTEDAVRSTRDQRIASVAKFIASRAMAFHRSLKPRERTNFGPEDIELELWVSLAERDHKWNPSAGKYITFAGAIIGRALADIRDRSRTVESPRNSTCRMREYGAEAAGGRLSESRKHTSEDIRRTKDGIGVVGDFAIATKLFGDAGSISEAEENAELLRSLVSEAVATCLTAQEARVIGHLFGLWGMDPIGESDQSLVMAAWRLQMSPADVQQAKDSALSRLRAWFDENVSKRDAVILGRNAAWEYTPEDQDDAEG